MQKLRYNPDICNEACKTFHKESEELVAHHFQMLEDDCVSLNQREEFSSGLDSRYCSKCKEGVMDL